MSSIPDVTGSLSLKHKVIAVRVTDPGEVDGMYSSQDLAVAEMRMKASTLGVMARGSP